jgi:hypothetical protein
MIDANTPAFRQQHPNGATVYDRTERRIGNVFACNPETGEVVTYPMDLDLSIIRRDQNLYVMACNIFGADIVADAFITTYDYGNSESGEIEKRLVAESFKKVEPEIDIGSTEVIIVFVNGKSVSIWSSEFGAIRNTDMNKETKMFDNH